MKKILSFILSLMIIAAIPVTALAASGVPSAVLKAEASVVRVFADYSNDISSGSGFVVKSSSKQTLIVTNNHVVECRPTEIGVWINGRLVNASVLAQSKSQDLCILSLNEQVKATPLRFDTKPSQGESVYAIGFPGDADYLTDSIALESSEATLTDGIISAMRQYTITDRPVSILQINADINHGNSGGPLVNSKGQVLGVNTYGVSSGINGAIAASEVLALANNYGIKLNSFNWLVIVIPLAIIAIAAVVIIIMRKISIKPNKQKKNISLMTYVTTLGYKLSVEQAVSLLMPVAIQLRDMHNSGRPHLQVSPNTIEIGKKGVTLIAPSGNEANRYCTGFAAPEIYRGKNSGFLSDVYSFCAVLFFCISGEVPANALERADSTPEHFTVSIPDEEIVSIIEKGISFAAENRFSSMNDIILKLSPYNTASNIPLANAPTSEKPTKVKVKKERKKLSHKAKVKIAIITPIAALSVLVLAYFGTYFTALHFANENDYPLAVKYAFVPQLTAIHDPQFANYINTCKTLLSGDTLTAEHQFAEYGDYLRSAQMVYECQYIRGIQQFNSGDYQGATGTFRSLVVMTGGNYKDVREHFVKSVEEHVFECLDVGDYSSAIMFLIKHEKIDKEIEKDKKEIIPIIYDGAVKCYRAKEYDKASVCFGSLGDYKESEKYNRLIKYHTLYANLWWAGDNSDYAYFIKDLDFEDTKKVIMSNENLALQFLLGKWSASSGGKSIEFKKQDSGYWCSYTLPYFSLSNSHFSIQNGIYKISNEKEIKDMYRFTIIDSHTIDVYCYKDGSTYRLYKQ